MSHLIWNFTESLSSFSIFAFFFGSICYFFQKSMKKIWVSEITFAEKVFFILSCFFVATSIILVLSAMLFNLDWLKILIAKDVYLQEGKL